MGISSRLLQQKYKGSHFNHSERMQVNLGCSIPAVLIYYSSISDFLNQDFMLPRKEVTTCDRRNL